MTGGRTARWRGRLGARPVTALAVGSIVGILVVVTTAGPAASRPAPGPAVPPPGTPDWTATGVRIEPVGPDQDQEVDVTGIGGYRGAIVLQPATDSGGMTVVNDVAFDDYLRGIAEVPSDWPPAALQAQAIAARTYALHTLALGQPLCATDACQVYAGLAKERADTGGWAAAVAATKDQVLLYRGAPALTMYSSSNGGQMVSGSQPYLRAGPDPDDAVSPVHLWHSSIALSALQAAFSTSGPVTGVAKTDHDTVALTWSGPPASSSTSTSSTSTTGPPESTTTTTGSTTTTTLEATTSTSAPPTTLLGPAPPGAGGAAAGTQANGTQAGDGTGTAGAAAPAAAPESGSTGSAASTTSTTSAPSSADGGSGQTNRTEVATADFVGTLNSTQPAPDGLPLLLPSSRFDIKVDTVAGTATFDGKGFGHGIGMSQFGALGKARRGLKATDILAAYYGGLRPVAAPAGLIPAVVPVVLDDGRSTVTVTAPGRFRVLAADGTVLSPLAHGLWQFTPAGPGRLRIVPPDDQRGPLTVTPVGARFTGDPVSGGVAEIHVRLSLPAVVRAAVVPTGALAAPGAIPDPSVASLTPANAASQAPPAATPASPATTEPVATGASPAADPGEAVIQVPFAPGITPTWDVKIDADAGAGRTGETALLLDIRVSSLPAAVDDRHGGGAVDLPGTGPLGRPAAGVPLAVTIGLLALAWGVTARPLRPAGAGSEPAGLP